MRAADGEPLARGGVVGVEEPRHQPRAEDEADSIAARVVPHAERRAWLDVRRALAHRPHDSLSVRARASGHAEVARDGADRPAGRERHGRQRAVAVRTEERAEARHVRAVAAGEHDAVGPACGDVARHPVEIVEALGLVHARAPALRRSDDHAAQALGHGEPARLAVQNDVAARAHLLAAASTPGGIELRRRVHGERSIAAISRVRGLGGAVRSMRRVPCLAHRLLPFARDARGRAGRPGGPARGDRGARECRDDRQRRGRVARPRGRPPRAALRDAGRRARSCTRRPPLRARTRRRVRRSHASARRGRSRCRPGSNRRSRSEPVRRARLRPGPRIRPGAPWVRAPSCDRPTRRRAAARSSTRTRSCAGRPRAPHATPRTRPTG